MGEEFTEYNHNNIFKGEILPLLVKIKQICFENKIPYYITFATENKNNITNYMTTKLLPPETEVALYKDKFKNILLAENGFELAMNKLDVFDQEFVKVPPEASEKDEDDFFE